MSLIPHPFQVVIETVPAYLKLSVCVRFLRPRNNIINSLLIQEYPNEKHFSSWFFNTFLYLPCRLLAGVIVKAVQVTANVEDVCMYWWLNEKDG